MSESDQGFKEGLEIYSAYAKEIKQTKERLVEVGNRLREKADELQEAIDSFELVEAGELAGASGASVHQHQQEINKLSKIVEELSKQGALLHQHLMELQGNDAFLAMVALSETNIKA